MQYTSDSVNLKGSGGEGMASSAGALPPAQAARRGIAPGHSTQPRSCAAGAPWALFRAHLSFSPLAASQGLPYLLQRAHPAVPQQPEGSVGRADGRGLQAPQVRGAFSCPEAKA